MKKTKKEKKQSKLRGKISRFFKTRNKGIASFLILVLLSGTIVIGATNIAALVYVSEEVSVGANADMVLRYDKPASKISLKQPLINLASAGSSEDNRYQQTVLPIGNGDLGASIYGEISQERIVINEKTLWTGGPKSGDASYNGGNITDKDASGNTMSDYYYQVRELLANGNEKEAEKVFSKIRGDKQGVYGSYQCFGDLTMSFGHKRATDYERALNIDNAVATVSYKVDGAEHTREYIASDPDNVFAAKIASQGKALDFKVGYSSRHGAKSVAQGSTITFSGELQDNGMRYCTVLSVVTDGGSAVAEGDGIRVSGTHEAVIFLSAATDYADNFPVYRTGETLAELSQRVYDTVFAAAEKGYEQVKADHVNDYKNLYDRFRIDFGGKTPRYTTDKLVRKYATPFLWNSERRYLEQLMTCYGRYLLISSSRKNSQLPANLQGVWNNSNDAKWGSDYHINVNLQMNYWHAYTTGLSECADPLVRFVDALREPGRITSKTYTGTADEAARGISDEEYGFLAHTECTPFGYTAPGEGEYAKAQWSPPAVAWLIQNLYEGYEYGLDKDYLARIYPIMKEATVYFDRTLMDDGSGKLVSAPSYSPEHGGIKLGSVYEQSLIWQLYNDTITAAEILGADADKVAQWKDTKSKLKTIEINSKGQIKEWYDESGVSSVESYFHRHASHLLGLHPGDLITQDNVQWMQAAVKSLNNKCDITTGWASAQRINLWARTGNGDEAYKALSRQIKQSVYPNLWDAHPPFQIDGNFGFTAGVAEMLVQSNADKISFLPALPKAWQSGEVSGLRVRGNAEVALSWRNGALTSASVTAYSDGELKFSLSTLANKRVYTQDGQPVSTQTDGTIVSFNARANTTYIIK